MSVNSLGKNGANCSPETGQCHCPAGWAGQQCDRPCSNNSYGMQCGQKCACKNGGSCNPVNGRLFFFITYFRMNFLFYCIFGTLDNAYELISTSLIGDMRIILIRTCINNVCQ